VTVLVLVPVALLVFAGGVYLGMYLVTSAPGRGNAVDSFVMNNLETSGVALPMQSIAQQDRAVRLGVQPPLSTSIPLDTAAAPIIDSVSKNLRGGGKVVGVGVSPKDRGGGGPIAAPQPPHADTAAEAKVSTVKTIYAKTSAAKTSTGQVSTVTKTSAKASTANANAVKTTTAAANAVFAETTSAKTTTTKTASAAANPVRSLEVAAPAPVPREERLRPSLHADGVSHFEGPADPSMDGDGIVIGAFVFLADSAVSIDDMRTVFSNKASGCDRDAARNGISMFVNSWQTSDRRLFVEYGSRDSGCEKLDSGNVLVSYNRWYHFAASFVRDSIAIYIDGRIVGRRVGAHIPQASQPLIVGMYDNKEGLYPLYGNVSHLAIARCSSESAAAAAVASMMDLDTIRSTQGLTHIYPLSEAASPAAATKALETVSGRHGTYVFRTTGASISVSGIPFQLNYGFVERPVSDEERSESDMKGRTRSKALVQAMRFVWDNYRMFAWGSDELKPISKRGHNNWGSMGMTLVDSLDTLWLMGMKEEFDDAVAWVKSSLSFAHAGTVSTFETTIRALGGLLSAYDLSGEPALIDKADDLGRRLVRAFNTGSGIASGQVDLGATDNRIRDSTAVLSELGTLQVEFRYLAQITKNSEYETKAMRAFQVLSRKNPKNGLFPIKVSTRDGSFVDSHVTFGALGDSFFEYLLKVWIQGGKKEAWLRDMYDKAIDGAISQLLKSSKKTGLAYLSDWDGHSNEHKMDHLVCFMPGLLALGSVHDPQGRDSPRAKRDMSVAKALMYTCREMYHRTATGIAPEFVTFDTDMNTRTSATYYILRPETAESLFILHQLTREPIYREWAWEIWEAIDRRCKTTAGYGALHDVNDPSAAPEDRMESFFLAETMKYLYLAQALDHPMDLNKYVFNTEAHPMRILDETHVPITAGI
jgi:mannosyl-oligosaccharide alpha-1,2-mannosidase